MRYFIFWHIYNFFVTWTIGLVSCNLRAEIKYIKYYKEEISLINFWVRDIIGDFSKSENAIEDRVIGSKSISKKYLCLVIKNSDPIILNKKGTGTYLAFFLIKTLFKI